MNSSQGDGLGEAGIAGCGLPSPCASQNFQAKLLLGIGLIGLLG